MQTTKFFPPFLHFFQVILDFERQKDELRPGVLTSSLPLACCSFALIKVEDHSGEVIEDTKSHEREDEIESDGIDAVDGLF